MTRRSVLMCFCVFHMYFAMTGRPLMAAGMALHIWMADEARQYLQADELNELLQRHQATYRNGAVFPDTGYTIKHPYGEYSHWHEFQNAYYSAIRDRCPQRLSPACEQAFAHLLGAVAHSLADVNFDRHFVHEAAQLDYNGDMGESQKWLDPGCDFLAILEHGRGFKLPAFKVPMDFLIAGFDKQNGFEVSSEELRRGNHLHSLVVAVEPLASPFTYLFYKAKMPWAAKNYVNARGGVSDTAKRIAVAWDLIWQHYQSGSDSLLFYSEGGWPNVDYFIDEQYFENFDL